MRLMIKGDLVFPEGVFCQCVGCVRLSFYAAVLFAAN